VHGNSLNRVHNTVCTKKSSLKEEPKDFQEEKTDKMQKNRLYGGRRLPYIGKRCIHKTERWGATGKAGR
jgi:hypothetical protein